METTFVIHPKNLPSRLPIQFTLWAWLADSVWAGNTVLLVGLVVAYWVLMLSGLKSNKFVDITKGLRSTK